MPLYISNKCLLKFKKFTSLGYKYRYLDIYIYIYSDIITKIRLIHITFTHIDYFLFYECVVRALKILFLRKYKHNWLSLSHFKFEVHQITKHRLYSITFSCWSISLLSVITNIFFYNNSYRIYNNLYHIYLVPFISISNRLTQLEIL